MPAVKLEKICKSFPGILANSNVNFEVDYGEVHALVGENGAGKTTLMRVLSGYYAPDSGRTLINGEEYTHYSINESRKRGIAMVHQNFMQVPSLSVLENVILGSAPEKISGVIDYKMASKRVEKFLASMNMNISPKTLVSQLSVGERQKIEILKVLYLGANILIFDEPTAVLTPQEANDLFKIIEGLKSEGKAIIYISHKLNEVITIADKATVMRKGDVVATFPDKASMTVGKLASSMVGIPNFKMVTNENGSSNDGEIVLRLDNIWYVDTETNVNKITNLSFQVKRGEILGIGGVEGNGQQELSHLIMGMLKQNGGRIILDNADISNADTHERRENGLGYISEDRMISGVSLDSSIQENIICGKADSKSFSHRHVLRWKHINSVAANMIEHYDIYCGKLNSPVWQLSGGNMQKVILARELEQNPKLLIASHPTRGLDVNAINFVRQQLLNQKKRGAGILLITADLEELLALSDRILVIYEGQFTGEITDIASTSEEEIGLLMGGVHQNGSVAKQEVHNERQS